LRFFALFFRITIALHVKDQAAPKRTAPKNLKL
jgi:hypothetical protein